MNAACNNTRRPEPGPVLSGPADAAAVVRLSVSPDEQAAVVLLLCDPDHRLLLAITVEGAPVRGVTGAVDLVLQVADSGGVAGLVVGIVRARGGRLSKSEAASLAGLLARCDAAGVDLLDVLVVGRRGYRSLWHLAEAPAEGEDGDSEQSRHALYLRLEETLGPEAASTLMEHLPPLGWGDVATKRDLDALAALTKRDLDANAAVTKRDLDALAALTKRDLDALAALTKRDLDAHAAVTKRDLDALAATLRQDLETLEQRLRADLRSELMQTVTAQTRTIAFSVIGSNVTIGALAFAAASLR